MLFFEWEDAGIWAHGNYSFDMHLSYLGPVSCVLSSCTPSGVTIGGCCSLALLLGRIEGRRRRGNRGWNGCMASLAQWVWVWANSGRSWRAGNPGILQSMGSQWVRHDWATEQQQHIAWFFVCLFPSCVPKGLTSSLTQMEVAAIIDDSDILSLLAWEAVFYFSTVKVLIMRKLFCNCVG